MTTTTSKKLKRAKTCTTTMDHKLLEEIFAQEAWNKKHPILVFLKWLWRRFLHDSN